MKWINHTNTRALLAILTVSGGLFIMIYPLIAQVKSQVSLESIITPALGLMAWVFSYYYGAKKELTDEK
jgi:hypothetical protein